MFSFIVQHFGQTCCCFSKVNYKQSGMVTINSVQYAIQLINKATCMQITGTEQKKTYLTITFANVSIRLNNIGTVPNQPPKS